MDSMLTQPVFQAYAISVAILVLTLYGLGFFTAKTRAERKVVVNPEDVSVNAGSSVAESDHPDVLRVKRAHINLIENAVPFFAIGFLYTLSSPGLNVARGIFGTFVLVRVLHAIFYLSAKQPFRTGSFAVGALINVFMVVQVLRAALGG